MRDLPLKVGDRVFLRNYVHTVGKSKKLFFPWKGTFRIIQIDQPYALITSCSSPNTTPKRVHINQLKPCFEITGPASTSKDPFPEEEMAGCEAQVEQTEPVVKVRRKSPKSKPPPSTLKQPKLSQSRPTPTHSYDLRPRKHQINLIEFNNATLTTSGDQREVPILLADLEYLPEELGHLIAGRVERIIKTKILIKLDFTSFRHSLFDKLNECINLLPHTKSIHIILFQRFPTSAETQGMIDVFPRMLQILALGKQWAQSSHSRESLEIKFSLSIGSLNTIVRVDNIKTI